MKKNIGIGLAATLLAACALAGGTATPAHADYYPGDGCYRDGHYWVCPM